MFCWWTEVAINKSIQNLLKHITVGTLPDILILFGNVLLCSNKTWLEMKQLGMI